MGSFTKTLLMQASAAILAAWLFVGVLGREPYHTPAKGGLQAKAAKSGAGTQYMDCYDYQPNTGNQLRVIDYIPQLRAYNFDNIISYCCLTGIWLLYQDENFNAGNTYGADIWAFGNNYCIQMPSGFDNQASSLRYTGAPDDWHADTLNLYLNDYFIGGEEYAYGDIAQVNYNDQAKSIVVTGCSGWTLYEGANYSGLCKCVWPASTSQCTPGFYKTSKDLGNMAGRISSARHGCFCGSSLKPNNHAASNVRGSQRAGNSQFYETRDSA